MNGPPNPPDPAPAPSGRRAIRSFVRRAGRMTRAQARALDELWPQHGVRCGDGLLDWHRLFGRVSPVVLEIGTTRSTNDGADLSKWGASTQCSVHEQAPHSIGSLLREPRVLPELGPDLRAKHPPVVVAYDDRRAHALNGELLPEVTDSVANHVLGFGGGCRLECG